MAWRVHVCICMLAQAILAQAEFELAFPPLSLRVARLCGPAMAANLPPTESALRRQRGLRAGKDPSRGAKTQAQTLPVNRQGGMWRQC